jgi:hypothetical protein
VDSFEGGKEDPLSLHKYSYANSDPIQNCDFSGNAVHHKVPQSLWGDFSEEAKLFFDSGEATVDAIGHDMSCHGGYLKRSEELINEWIRLKGVAKGSMKAAHAKALLKYLEKDAFISGFNAVVPGGPKAVSLWVFNEGSKLLPTHLQGRALKGAKALCGRKGYLKGLIKKGTGAYLTIGFAVLTASTMYANGASDQEVAKAVVNDLYFGIPDLAHPGADAAWGEANYIASQARGGAFSYLDYDPENDEFDGSNGLLTSEQAVDGALRRQNRSGQTVTAGSLLW